MQHHLSGDTVMTFRALFGSLALMAVLALTPAVAAPIVTDGDFLNGFGSFSTINSGSTLASGAWTVTQGSVDQIGGYWQAPTLGGGSVDLDGYYARGGISQIIAPSAGNYRLTFYMSGNPDGGNPLKGLTASVGGTSQDFYYTTGSNSLGDMQYAFESLYFFTAGGNIALSFTSLDDISSAFGAAIGGVSITAVPEPLTLTLFGAGLAGIAGLRRRKKAAQA
jgi:choice-of-anchor C domain-containing protein